MVCWEGSRGLALTRPTTRLITGVVASSPSESAPAPLEGEVGKGTTRGAPIPIVPVSKGRRPRGGLRPRPRLPLRWDR